MKTDPSGSPELAIAAHRASHLVNTTSVASPPAGPAGPGLLSSVLSPLVESEFTIWAPNGCCIPQFRAYQSFVCNLLSTPRCES